MTPIPQGHWSPYLAGALVGVVAVLSVTLTGKYLGTSTTFVRTAGAAIGTVAPAHVATNAYYEKVSLRFDWQAAAVLGILIGALLASRTGRTFKAEAVPPMWAERFGPSRGKRALVAFAGGVLALFGARLAGGCPSGHGLSGLMTLSVSGLLAMVGFLGGGLLTANLVYRRTRS